jgi:glyceraldehyde-3-phosphate dehydrogenase (NADP+)
MNNTFFPTENDIPPEYKISPLEQRTYLVNGELRGWIGPVQKVYSPVCIRDGDKIEQKYIGSFPDLSPAESLEALEAAVNAYDNGKGEWPTASVEERIGCVENFIDKMGEKKRDVVNLLMWEIGKPYNDSVKEFDRTIDYMRKTIYALKELENTSSRFTKEDGIIAQIRRSPLGTVLCMGPYNYPLNETLTTLIPALIMGNTVVFKPAKYGVLLHEPLLEAYQESFPPGVINTVYGDGPKVIGPIMESGKIDVLAFIGATKTADILKQQHPKPHRLRSVLGLGAKNPAIILPDADIENTIKECLQGSLSYSGQRCTALKIIYVHRSIADEFIYRFAEKVDSLVCGMPWTPNVAITPMPEPNKTDKMTEYVNDAIANGAWLINKGGEADHTFFSPAVLYHVNKNMKLYYEEQFGPIVPIIPFDDIKEPLNYVINSDVGQQLSIFGKNPKTIAKLITSLSNQVCRINLNSQCQRGPDVFPFAGRKDSAEGTLSVSDALRVFSIRSMVAAKESEENKGILNSILQEDLSNYLSTDFIF